MAPVPPKTVAAKARSEKRGSFMKGKSARKRMAEGTKKKNIKKEEMADGAQPDAEEPPSKSKLRRLKRQKKDDEGNAVADGGTPAVSASDDKAAFKQRNALEYLTTWRMRATHPWRFNKKFQSWWLVNATENVVSKDDFALFCEYAETIAGASRERLLADAKQAIVDAVTALEADETDKDAKRRKIRSTRIAKLMQSPVTSESRT